MRTFLAFKYDNEIIEAEINEGIKRVKKHYYESHPINFEVEVNVYIHNNIGAVIFDSKDTPLRWKNIQENESGALVTFSPPPNWKKFSVSGDIEKAPLELLNQLMINKKLQSKFSTPTCVCTINKDTDELDIFTDPLGFARLYEYKGKNGWFWSNRPGALTLMAGEEAKFDRDAWEFFSSAGWFVDTTSPIEKVVRVEPGLRINATSDFYEPRSLVNYGAFEKMVSPRKYKKFNAKSIATDMLENLASYSELWSLPFDVDLSGGKDSRVCSAAVIASKTEDVQFNTIATFAKEAETAQNLLGKVNLTHKHNIIQPSERNKNNKVVKTPLKKRIRTLFHHSDGDLTPVLTRTGVFPETHFSNINKIWIQGAMGEIGKATFYSSETFYKRLIKKGNAAAYERVTRAYSLLDGVKPEVTDKANQFMFSVIQKGKAKGISDLYLLDYFYLVERARRWLPQNSDISRYSAFFSNEYLEQSFNMSYEEKLNLDVFTSVIEELVPEWKDVPFYRRKLTDRDERTEKGLRLWQTSDKEDIEEILSNPKKWNDMFDEEKITNIWNSAIDGDFHPGIESLFDRLVMRATFQDHLDRINIQLRENDNEAMPKERKKTFTPSNELNINEEIRLVIYDNNTKEYIVDVVISPKDSYVLDSKVLQNNENLKYKYQKNDYKKWIDIMKYETL